MENTQTSIQTKFEPLWQVRLKLFLKSLRTNWLLFSESPIGLVGLGLIIFFGLFSLAHPILMNTVWDHSVYDPVVGHDLEVAFHPSPPSSKHLLGTDPLGRDILSQLMFSTKYEFALGIISSVVTVVLIDSTTMNRPAAIETGRLRSPLYCRSRLLQVLTR